MTRDQWHQGQALTYVPRTQGSVKQGVSKTKKAGGVSANQVGYTTPWPCDRLAGEAHCSQGQMILNDHITLVQVSNIECTRCIFKQATNVMKTQTMKNGR